MTTDLNLRSVLSRAAGPQFAKPVPHAPSVGWVRLWSTHSQNQRRWQQEGGVETRRRNPPLLVTRPPGMPQPSSSKQANARHTNTQPSPPEKRILPSNSQPPNPSSFEETHLSHSLPSLPCLLLSLPLSRTFRLGP